MRRKTKVLVGIAVVLCIVLAAGTAFAAPHRGGGHDGAHGYSPGAGTGTQTATPFHTQCTYADCPRVTGKPGSCINESCRYYQSCPNEDCPGPLGETCTNADCPFSGSQPKNNQPGTSGNATGGPGHDGHKGGRHGGRHH